MTTGLTHLLVESSDSELQLRLDSRLGVSQAQQICETLQTAVSREANLAVFCDDVDILDVSILQLLLAAKTELQLQQRRLELRGVSPELSAFLATTGLADSFA